jgi:acyl dehydratase
MSERTFTEPPNLLALYGKAALGGVPMADKVPFLGIGGRSKDVPETVLVVPEAKVDPDRLADYCRVCGFTLRDTLPLTYPHMLAFPLHMSLMAEEDFPFGAVGLVHIANEITQHRAIRLGETMEIRVSATPLAPHPKGRQFAFVTEARVGEELVWESRSTTLRRGSGGDESAADKPGAFESTDFEALPAAAEWKLDAGLGRRYGAVSGDRNPIHMSEWTAKPLGFPKAIAHGMWTKARALAALEGDTPDSARAEVRFKRPILLPGRVSFASAPRVEGAEGEIAFAVRDARKGTPHLEGLLTPL